MKDVHVTRDVLGNVVSASKVRALDFDETSDNDGTALRRDQVGNAGSWAYFLPRFQADQ